MGLCCSDCFPSSAEEDPPVSEYLCSLMKYDDSAE